LFNFFKESRISQFFILTLFIIFYIGCGIIHHLLEKTLHLKIVVEYILIGATALFLLKNLLIPYSRVFLFLIFDILFLIFDI